MNTRNQTETTRGENREAQAPALIAYHVSERGEKKFWTRIGAAWHHDDQKGLTVQLELLPAAGGRIVLREANREDERQAS